jgi:hypothetical protein
MSRKRDPFYRPPAAPSGGADPLYSAVPMAEWYEKAHVRLPLAQMQAAEDEPEPAGWLELFLAERDAMPWEW